jgi:hypothetical protein
MMHRVIENLNMIISLQGSSLGVLVCGDDPEHSWIFQILMLLYYSKELLYYIHIMAQIWFHSSWQSPWKILS